MSEGSDTVVDSAEQGNSGQEPSGKKKSEVIATEPDPVSPPEPSLDIKVESVTIDDNPDSDKGEEQDTFDSEADPTTADVRADPGAPTPDAPETPAPEGIDHPADNELHQDLSAQVTEEEEVSPDLAEIPAQPSRVDKATKAAAKDQEQYEKDCGEIDRQRDLVNHWKGVAENLQQNLRTIQESFNARIDENKRQLPDDLPEILKGRQTGLDLTVKMLSRLPERVATCVKVEEAFSKPSPPEGEESWEKSFESVSESALDNFIEQRLQTLGNERYQQVCAVREAATRARKGVLGVVERQLLPVLDALDDGERGLESMSDQEDNKKIITDWISLYGQVRDEILPVLEGFGIHPLEPEPGEPMNYERHEPLDLEEKEGWPDETVKSVIRKGYILRYEEQETLIRPAQVIVVKNGHKD